MIARIAHSAMHRVFTHVRPPAYRRVINRLVAMTRPPAPAATPYSREMAARIERDGFLKLDDAFDKDMLRRLRAALSERMCHDQWNPAKGRFRLEDTPADTNNARIIGVEDIPEAQAIAHDPRVIGIVSQYLGCMPKIDEILSWWSLPRSGPVEEQFFHRDNPSTRWLKLFIYLSDVGETEGPHTFVRGSQMTNELLDMGQRFTDEQVRAQVDPDRIVRFTGPFGTAFLEDTYGLHKGEVPTGDMRLIFEVTYSTYMSPLPIRQEDKAGAPPRETAPATA